MERLEVSTLVYLPPAEIFEFLLDFPGYAEYAGILNDVRQVGPGGPGTEYHLRFGWWKLAYTAEAEVTEVEAPTRIEWRLTKDLDARGRWRIEERPDEVPASREAASLVRLVVEYDLDSADAETLNLPALVTLDSVVSRVTPLLEDAAQSVVERVVADLEGERRPVDLRIDHGDS